MYTEFSHSKSTNFTFVFSCRSESIFAFDPLTLQFRMNGSIKKPVKNCNFLCSHESHTSLYECRMVCACARRSLISFVLKICLTKITLVNIGIFDYFLQFRGIYYFIRVFEFKEEDSVSISEKCLFDFKDFCVFFV